MNDILRQTSSRLSPSFTLPLKKAFFASSPYWLISLAKPWSKLLVQTTNESSSIMKSWRISRTTLTSIDAFPFKQNIQAWNWYILVMEKFILHVMCPHHIEKFFTINIRQFDSACIGRVIDALLPYCALLDVSAALKFVLHVMHFSLVLHTIPILRWPPEGGRVLGIQSEGNGISLVRTKL